MLDILQRFLSGLENRNPQAAELMQEMTERLQALLEHDRGSDLADHSTVHDTALTHIPTTFDHLI